jgi:hypothetical protein
LPSRSLPRAILDPSGVRVVVVGQVERPSRLAAAVGVHHVDLAVAVAQAPEGDLRSVGDQAG